MKIKNFLYINYVITVIAIIFALLQEGDVSSLLLWVGFPQFFALILTLSYFHAKNVLKVAGRCQDLKSSINSKFALVFFVLCFLASIPLSFLLGGTAVDYVIFRFFAYVSFLSNLMALYLIGVLIFIMYPLQVKFNAGVYKKIID